MEIAIIELEALLPETVNPWYLAGGVDAAHVAAWQAKGAVSLAASYLKLGGASFGHANIDPSVVGGVAPTWDATDGWQLDRSIPQYLDTGFIPISGMSIFCRFSNCDGTTDRVLIGSSNGGFSGITCLIPSGSGGAVAYYWGGNNQNKSPAITDGVLGVAGTKCYRNGIDDGLTLVPGAFPTVSLWIGALHMGGAILPNQAYIQALWLSDIVHPDPPALSAAIAAL